MQPVWFWRFFFSFVYSLSFRLITSFFFISFFFCSFHWLEWWFSNLDYLFVCLDSKRIQIFYIRKNMLKPFKWPEALAILRWTFNLNFGFDFSYISHWMHSIKSHAYMHLKNVYIDSLFVKRLPTCAYIIERNYCTIYNFRLNILFLFHHLCVHKILKGAQRVRYYSS